MFENAPPSAGEIRALANQLLSWANHLAAVSASAREPRQEERLEFALGRAIAAREAAHLREQAFPEIDFGNPAWLVVLELYIREANGYRVAPERLPLLALLPSETVEGVLGQLQRAQIAEIVPDLANPALHWVRLTEDGSCRMTDLLLESTHLARSVAPDSPAQEPSALSFPE